MLTALCRQPDPVFGQHRRNARVDRLRSLKAGILADVPADDLAGRAADDKDVAFFQLCHSQQLGHSLPRLVFDLLFELFRHKKHLVYTLADSRLAEPAAPKYTLLPAGQTAVQPSISRPVKVRSQLPSAVSTASAQGASADRPNSFCCIFSPARRAMLRSRVRSAFFSSQLLRAQR